MSVEEYALVFTRLSRFAPSIVANPRMKMSKFMSDVSDLISKECSRVILENDMNIDCLVPLKFNQERVPTPKTQGVSGIELYVIKPTCVKCGRKNNGECLVGTDGCYSCGGSGHKKRNCPVLTAKGRDAKQASLRGSGTSDPQAKR
ncbi:hypothetical protein RDI58_021949 [Solanum bulbocastanum]|uniref:CCHC-type domain-containing protein n=1 Tax=Solanum bulbocastanum TaxID=147425 RepID=A0AAN8T150_SOLBU